MSEKIGNRIIRLDEVDSTNSYLKGRNDLLQQHGLVVIADMQTSGRGRVGREFVSLRGKNLTFSVVLHPELPLGEIQVLSLLASVAVSRVLEKYLNKIRLKWPNDVLVCEKKSAESQDLTPGTRSRASQATPARPDRDLGPKKWGKSELVAR